MSVGGIGDGVVVTVGGTGEAVIVGAGEAVGTWAGSAVQPAIMTIIKTNAMRYFMLSPLCRVMNVMIILFRRRGGLLLITLKDCNTGHGLLLWHSEPRTIVRGLHILLYNSTVSSMNRKSSPRLAA